MDEEILRLYDLLNQLIEETISIKIITKRIQQKLQTQLYKMADEYQVVNNSIFKVNQGYNKGNLIYLKKRNKELMEKMNEDGQVVVEWD
jgi:protocatechuate 3,4-dioxygenase beta subunit